MATPAELRQEIDSIRNQVEQYEFAARRAKAGVTRGSRDLDDEGWVSNYPAETFQAQVMEPCKTAQERLAEAIPALKKAVQDLREARLSPENRRPLTSNLQNVKSKVHDAARDIGELKTRVDVLQARGSEGIW
jgi:hypothetical protein